VLSRMSAISTLRSRVPVAWRIDFMRSCVIGLGSSVPRAQRDRVGFEQPDPDRDHVTRIPVPEGGRSGIS